MNFVMSVGMSSSGIGSATLVARINSGRPNTEMMNILVPSTEVHTILTTLSISKEK